MGLNFAILHKGFSWYQWFHEETIPLHKKVLRLLKYSSHIHKKMVLLKTVD